MLAIKNALDDISRLFGTLFLMFKEKKADVCSLVPLMG